MQVPNSLHHNKAAVHHASVKKSIIPENKYVILLDNPNPLRHSTPPTLVPQVCLLDHSDFSQLVVTPSLPHHAHSSAAVLPGSVYWSKIHVCPIHVLIKDSNAEGGGTVYSLEGGWSAEKERGRGGKKTP